MKQVVTKAIVLKRIKYQEADRILTLITSESGKLTVLARGVRKANSKLAGSIELFGTSNITYIPSRGEISTLISARLIKNYGNIVTDLERTQLAYIVLKLIDKNTEGSNDSEIYDLLEQALESLEQIEIDLDIIRFWFQSRFLKDMGHEPDLNIELNKADKYKFDLDKMAFFISDSGVFDQNHIKVFKLSLTNSPKQLNRITDIKKLASKLLPLLHALMFRNGFEPI